MKFKNSRVARRKVIRQMNRVIKLANKLNAYHNDGNSTIDVRKTLEKLRTKHIVAFLPLVN